MENKISEIIVYKDRACITRASVLKLKKGKNTVKFGELTPHLLDESVNVRLESAKSVKFEGMELIKKTVENIKNEQIKALEERLKKYNEEITALDLYNARLKNSKDIINKIKTLKSENIFKEFYLGNKKPEDIKSEYDFIKDNMINLQNEELKTFKNRKNLLKKIKAVQTELNAKIKSRFKDVVDINVFIDSADEEEITVHLTYISLNASWTPVYDARLNTIKDELELKYYGMIKQFTGEDWNDVKIILSTANPAVGAYIPDLMPSFINFVNNEMPLPSVSSGINAPETEASSDTANLTVNFIIQKNDTVKSDGTEKKALISSNKFNPAYEYNAAPKIAENVYINGIFENNLEYPFLAGNVKVFHDGDYIGDSWTKNIIPQELFKLSLGTDAGFKIKRNLVNRLKSKKGITGNNAKFEYHYSILIDNFKKTPAEITITDHIPVSENKEIKIKLESSTDRIEADGSGILKWKKTIEPGKKTEISYIFNIEYPGGRTVTGLE